MICLIWSIFLQRQFLALRCFWLVKVLSFLVSSSWPLTSAISWEARAMTTERSSARWTVELSMMILLMELTRSLQCLIWTFLQTDSMAWSIRVKMLPISGIPLVRFFPYLSALHAKSLYFFSFLSSAWWRSLLSTPLQAIRQESTQFRNVQQNALAQLYFSVLRCFWNQFLIFNWSYNPSSLSTWFILFWCSSRLLIDDFKLRFSCLMDSFCSLNSSIMLDSWSNLQESALACFLILISLSSPWQFLSRFIQEIILLDTSFFCFLVLWICSSNDFRSTQSEFLISQITWFATSQNLFSMRLMWLIPDLMNFF